MFTRCLQDTGTAPLYEGCHADIDAPHAARRLCACGARRRPDPAAAEAPPAGKQTPGIYRYKIGTFEITALYDGIWFRPITDKFIRNAAFAEVEHALADAFMPADKLATPFTTLVVNTGEKLVLIDTGTGGQIAPSAGVLRDNLNAAGIDAKAVDMVVISHFHPDTSTASRTRTTR